MAAERGIDAILPTTATPAVALAALGWVQRHERSFGGVRPNPTTPTRLDEGSSRAKNALLAENARSTELPNDFWVPYSNTPWHQPPPEKAQNYEIDSTDDQEAQKNPIEKKSSRKGAVLDWRNPTV